MNIYRYMQQHKCSSMSVSVCVYVCWEGGGVCKCRMQLIVLQSFFHRVLFFLPPSSFPFREVPYPDMWELGHIAHYHPTLIKVPILETDSCCHVP